MHARGSAAALRRLAASAIVAACGMGAAPTLAASGNGFDSYPTPGRFQAADDDLDGEARVRIDVAPVRRETVIVRDASGGAVSEVALAEVETGGRRGEAISVPPPTATQPVADAVPETAPTEAAVETAPAALADAAPAAGAPVAAAEPAPTTAADAPTVPAEAVPLSAPVAVGEADGESVDLGDVSTGGQRGASVVVGDTIGGSGEPGAPGGDAIVEISVGPIVDGAATEGDASSGEVTPLDPAAVAAPLDQDPSQDVLIDVASADDPSTAARIALLPILGVVPEETGPAGPAVGGSATGGPAERGDASVAIVVGDTIGGDGSAGRAGGDAIVRLDVGPVSGGDAVGGAATGGGAIQGTGSALGGDATGGAARGGDADVVIGVGDTVGGDGDGVRPGEEAVVIVSLGSVEGGDAAGGGATGGEAWGLAGIAAEGGDAVGGGAAGGTAFVEISVGDLEGDAYRADVDRIVGGDATGGAATGGDAIDLER